MSMLGTAHAPLTRQSHPGAQRQAHAATLRASVPAPVDSFEPALVADLPEPARRWLSHAIEPGTPLAAGAGFRMHGEMLLDRWRSFTASHILAPGNGSVWTAQTQLAGIGVIGHDWYHDGAGEMLWHLGGLLPLHPEAGPDVSLSAFDRLAAEAVLVPTSLIEATWGAGQTPDSATYWQHCPSRQHRTSVVARVAPDGRLAEVSMWRWGNPVNGRRSYGVHRFALIFEGETRFGGVLYPRRMRAVWFGLGGLPTEILRASINAVTPLPAAT